MANKSSLQDSTPDRAAANYHDQEEHTLPLSGRLYLGARRTLELFFSFAKGCLNGISLGLLKAETMHKIDRHHFNENENIFYDEEYNRSGLHQWEERAICNYFRDCRHLLVTSVGGGREVLALQELGYVVDGFECNPGLLEFAKALCSKEEHAPNIILAARDECPIMGSIYDGAVVGWGSYLLIQGRKKRVEFLKQLRAQVKEGSPLLVSFFTRTHDTRYHRTVVTVGNIFRTLLGRDRVEPGDDLNPIYVHHFTEQEIASELREAGFTLKTYSPNQYGHAVGIASGPPY